MLRGRLEPVGSELNDEVGDASRFVLTLLNFAERSPNDRKTAIDTWLPEEYTALCRLVLTNTHAKTPVSCPKLSPVDFVVIHGPNNHTRPNVHATS